ncbi:Gfo/Idh/MocA family oxidoreductase [Candidatus Sumerlaeota bacterium]|nr:Gfo/Idh/MocA family oxidoreductase [Candidatus Sumerlaeota bacterium]
MGTVSRRGFLSTSAGAVAAAQLATGGARAAASDAVRVVVIGVGGRGRDHIRVLRGLKGVEVVGLCDPDPDHLRGPAQSLEKESGRKIIAETNPRRIFERKDVDAVTIATPNHWHALATIWACQAGKDVYVEKPGSHNVFEGRKMVEAAEKYGRMVQHGVQLRSSPAIKEAVKHLRDGLIGKVYMARGLVFRWRPSIDKKPAEEAVPEGLNWDVWQGPAQARPFSRRFVHYNWHWTWEYGNGDVGNQGTHETDMCQWGLDVKLPSQIVAMGGKFLFDDDKVTPEILTSAYYYPEENRMIEFEVRHWCTNLEDGAGVGNIFYGSEGYMVIKGYNSYETYLGEKRKPGPANKDSGEMELHMANWIEAIRTRKKESLDGPVETAHYSSALAHLGNIAFRVGRQLKFDPKTEKFVGDEEANALLTRNYRAPYIVPEKV